MQFKKRTLDNGLNIIGEINEDAKSAAVGFFVKTGSRDETAEINGVSHYLEHMLFKGTDQLSALQVNQAFDQTGAQFNAFTCEEMTVFYAAVLPEYLDQITALWAKLMRPALRDEDFNIEKNVILEEIAMYKDLPNFDVMDKCRTLHFDKHPCGNSVLGSNDSIKKLTAEQMRDYFSRRYAPNNITMVAVGNINWENTCQIAQKNCSHWKQITVKRVIEDYQGSKKKERQRKQSLAREHICIMSPAVSAQDPKRFTASLLSSIIGDSSGSRYFWKLIDNALAESASMQFGSMDGTGVFFSYFRCDTENTATVLNTIKDIFADLKQNGVTETELQAAKNKILSALVLKNELSMGRLIDLGFNWTYLQKYRRTDQDVKDINAVTTEQINQLIKQFDPGDFTQFSIGP